MGRMALRGGRRYGEDGTAGRMALRGGRRYGDDGGAGRTALQRGRHAASWLLVSLAPRAAPGAARPIRIDAPSIIHKNLSIIEERPSNSPGHEEWLLQATREAFHPHSQLRAASPGSFPRVHVRRNLRVRDARPPRRCIRVVNRSPWIYTGSNALVSTSGVSSLVDATHVQAPAGDLRCTRGARAAGCRDARAAAARLVLPFPARQTDPSGFGRPIRSGCRRRRVRPGHPEAWFTPGAFSYVPAVPPTGATNLDNGTLRKTHLVCSSPVNHHEKCVPTAPHRHELSWYWLCSQQTACRICACEGIFECQIFTKAMIPSIHHDSKRIYEHCGGFNQHSALVFRSIRTERIRFKGTRRQFRLCAHACLNGRCAQV